jgi:hypothetical protein
MSGIAVDHPKRPTDDNATHRLVANDGRMFQKNWLRAEIDLAGATDHLMQTQRVYLLVRHLTGLYSMQFGPAQARGSQL